MELVGHMPSRHDMPGVLFNSVAVTTCATNLHKGWGFMWSHLFLSIDRQLAAAGGRRDKVV